MKDYNIPNQYYKDLESGIEMDFKFDANMGWCVSFSTLEHMFKYTGDTPFPETPDKYKDQVERYYRDLKEKFDIGK